MNWVLLVAVDDASQAGGFFGAVQPDVGAAASYFVGRFGKELAHGGGEVAHVGQRGGGGEQLGQLKQAGGFFRGVRGLFLAEFRELQHGSGNEVVGD